MSLSVHLGKEYLVTWLMEDIAMSQAVKPEHACSCGAFSNLISMQIRAHRSSAESMLDGSKHGSESESVEQNGKSCTRVSHIRGAHFASPSRL